MLGKPRGLDSVSSAPHRMLSRDAGDTQDGEQRGSPLLQEDLWVSRLMLPSGPGDDKLRECPGTLDLRARELRTAKVTVCRRSVCSRIFTGK